MAVGQGHVCDCLAHYARLLGNVSNCKFAKITDYASMNSVKVSPDEINTDCKLGTSMGTRQVGMSSTTHRDHNWKN